MDLLSILVLIGIAIWILLAIRYMIKVKKKGGCISCGGHDCEECSMCEKKDKNQCSFCKK